MAAALLAVLTTGAPAGLAGTATASASVDRVMVAPASARSVATRAVAAQTARLEGQARAQAGARHADARLLAWSTLDAGAAASTVARPGVDPELVASLRRSEAALTAAVTAPLTGSAGPLPHDRATVDVEALTARVLAETAHVSALREAVRQSADEAAAGLVGLETNAGTAADAAVPLRPPRLATAPADLRTPRASLDPYPNGAFPEDALCGLTFDDDALLRCDAAAGLERLAVAYRDELGADLQVTSTYRTYDEQVAVKATKGWLAATPGTSNHGRGLAVDLGGLGGVGEFDSPAYLWLRANAGRFGWFHPAAMGPGGSGPAEPWHWEFSGVPGLTD